MPIQKAGDRSRRPRGIAWHQNGAMRRLWCRSGTGEGGDRPGDGGDGVGGAISAEDRKGEHRGRASGKGVLLAQRQRRGKLNLLHGKARRDVAQPLYRIDQTLIKIIEAFHIGHLHLH